MINIDKVSKKIAKSIIALNYDDINALHSQNGSNKQTRNIVNQFKKISKAIKGISQDNNNSNWWKIWKKYDDPDEIQDQIISYIAHQYFLDMQEQLNDSINLNKQVEDVETEYDGIDVTTLDRKTQVDLMKKMKQLEKLSANCVEDVDQTKNSIDAMKSRIDDLISFGGGGSIPSGLCSNKEKELYQGVCANRKVEEALNSLKKQLDKVKDGFDDEKKHKPADLSGGGTPRVFVAGIGDIFKGIKTQLSDAIKNNHHAEEKKEQNDKGDKKDNGNKKDTSSDKISIEEMMKKLKQKNEKIDSKNLQSDINNIEKFLKEVKNKITVEQVKKWKELNIDNTIIGSVDDSTVNNINTKIDNAINEEKNNLINLIKTLSSMSIDVYKIINKNDYANVIVNEVIDKVFNRKNTDSNKIYMEKADEIIINLFKEAFKEIKFQLQKLKERFETEVQDKYDEIKKDELSFERTTKISRKIANSYINRGENSHD